MNCPNCANPCPDGARFCDKCGAMLPEEVAETPAQPTPTEPTPEPTPEPMPAADAAQTPTDAAEPQPTDATPAPFAEPDFTPRKKPGRKAIAGIVTAAVALVLALAVALNVGAITGFAVRTFGSDADYFAYTEAKAFRRYVDSLTASYGELRSVAATDTAAQTKLQLQVGDSLSSLLNVGGLDLGWLDELALRISSNRKGDAQSAELALDVSDKEILALTSILDFAAQKFYLSMPALTDRVLSASFGDAGSQANAAAVQSVTELLPALTDALPTEKELNRLLLRYVDVALGQLTDVTKSSTTLTVGDVSQKCTELTLSITTTSLRDAAQAVLEEAKDDGELRAMLQKIQRAAEEVAGDNTTMTDSDSDLYTLFLRGVNEALEQLESVQAEDEGALFTLHDFVNGRDEIIGRTISDTPFLPGSLSYATVRKGSRFATEIKWGADEANAVALTGSGTERGDKQTASYQLTFLGSKVADFETQDCDVDAMREGRLNGTFRLTPDLTFLTQHLGANSEISGVLTMLRPSLELVCKAEKKESSVEIRLCNDENLLFGLTLSNTTSAGRAIEIPTENVVDATDTQAVQALLSSLDFDKLTEALQATDLPDAVVSQLQSLLSMLGSGQAQLPASE